MKAIVLSIIDEKTVENINTNKIELIVFTGNNKLCKSLPKNWQ